MNGRSSVPAALSFLLLRLLAACAASHTLGEPRVDAAAGEQDAAHLDAASLPDALSRDVGGQRVDAGWDGGPWDAGPGLPWGCRHVGGEAVCMTSSQCGDAVSGARPILDAEGDLLCGRFDCSVGPEAFSCNAGEFCLRALRDGTSRGNTCVRDRYCVEAAAIGEYHQCFDVTGHPVRSLPPASRECPSDADPINPLCGGACGDCARSQACVGRSETRDVGLCRS